MKTKEELNALKEEVENLNEKLAELTDEELAQVSGGRDPGIHTRHFIYPVVDETDDDHAPFVEPPVSPFTGKTSLTERPAL